MEKNASTADMQTMVSCTNKLVKDGFTDNFKVSGQGLLSPEKEKVYKPEEVKIVNFYRFEGASDPGDNTILYAIQTNDGTKGTLSDGYGPYADDEVSKFMQEVENIYKKTNIRPTDTNEQTVRAEDSEERSR